MGLLHHHHHTSVIDWIYLTFMSLSVCYSIFVFQINFGIYLMNHPGRQLSLPDTLSVGCQVLPGKKNRPSLPPAEEQTSGELAS